MTGWITQIPEPNPQSLLPYESIVDITLCNIRLCIALQDASDRLEEILGLPLQRGN